MSEIHIFIIWEKAINKEKIISNIRENFKILGCFEVKWSTENFDRNLLRLYGNSLKKAESKKNVCGEGPFLFMIVEDENPEYSNRNTLHGEDFVNINIFDKKIEYRKIAGGGQRVHASNSEKESKRAIGLILNRTFSDFEGKKEESTIFENIQEDPVGTIQWESLKQFFDFLNRTIDYVVLRNFEELPHKFKTGFDGDIDILAEDKNEIELLTNAKKISSENSGRRFRIIVNNEKVHLDLRYVGDGYLNNKWEKEILKHRKINNEIFVPDEKNFFYALLYHYLINKKSISEEQREKLLKNAENVNIKIKFDKDFNKESVRHILENFLKNEGFSYCRPIDNSVFFDNKFANDSETIIIENQLENNEKPEPNSIRLIKNSFFILKSEGIISLFQAAKAKLGI